MMKQATVMISGLLAVALIGASLAGLANARPFDGYGNPHEGKGYDMSRMQHGMIPPRLLDRLDLSDQQRDAIREIRKAQSSEAREKFRELRGISRELEGYAMRDDFTIEGARELAQSRARLIAELSVMRLSGMHQTWQVLSDEQKSKVEEWRAKHHRHGSGHERRYHHDRHPDGQRDRDRHPG